MNPNYRLAIIFVGLLCLFTIFLYFPQDPLKQFKYATENIGSKSAKNQTRHIFIDLNINKEIKYFVGTVNKIINERKNDKDEKWIIYINQYNTNLYKNLDKELKNAFDPSLYTISYYNQANLVQLFDNFKKEDDIIVKMNYRTESLDTFLDLEKIKLIDLIIKTDD